MAEGIVETFLWGLVIGVLLGMAIAGAVRNLLVRWFPRRMASRHEQEVRELRAEVNRLQSVIEEKNRHIRGAIQAAMDEMSAKKG